MSNSIDHRQLADEMEIFFLDEQIGAGLPVWLPSGVVIRDELENFVKDLERKAGFQRVVSPHLAKSILYEQSGHLKSFKDDMYPPISLAEGKNGEKNDYYLRPMNCPHHHKIFASQLRSFRQLPLRLAEYGQVYRYENSGALRGLSRVRGLCQNDAHIYIEPDQAFDEICSVLDMHEECYRKLGLKGYRYRLSLHDPKKPDVFEGADEPGQNLWLQVEAILREALVKKGLPFFESIGEAAFYGPKIDVQMKMVSGHEESVASAQIDFMSAARFDLSYIAKSGQPERPWIVHRAPLGSHERFVSLLLEYYEGQLPGWLSPVQLYVIPVSDDLVPEAKRLVDELIASGVRARLDVSGGSLSKRIHFAHRLRPFAKMVLGPKELSSNRLKIQFRDNENIEVEKNQVEAAVKSRLLKVF